MHQTSWQALTPRWRILKREADRLDVQCAADGRAYRREEEIQGREFGWRLNPPMSRYDAILFDFDGVLADTEPLHFESWAEALQPLGIRITWEFFQEHCIGIPDAQVAEIFRKLVDPPADYAAVWARKLLKRRLFLAKVKETPPFPDHVPEFIKSLADYKLAVVSASSRLELEPALEAAGILQCFAAIIGAEDVQHTKPAPDPYLRAVELLGVSRGLAVEDSEAGIASARAAGLAVLKIKDPRQMVPLVDSHLRKSVS